MVLMDLRMPNMDGIQATRRITAAHGDVWVVVLTTFDLDEYVYGSLRAGASAFLLKDAKEDQWVAVTKTHVASLLQKLRVRGRAQVVALADEMGLVQPGS